MKGDMALEYIFKVLITLVTIAVIIALIVKFSDDIKKSINDFLCSITGSCKKPTGPKSITQDSFTADEMANYIETCYDTQMALPENQQKDTPCFILFSKESFASSGINRVSLQQALPYSVADKVVFESDFTHDYLKINYEDLGNKIVVTESGD